MDPNLVLIRYAVERFLYRLSRSAHAERFVLKGALLLLAWFGDTLRPTRDAELTRIFADVCNVDVEQDAMTYSGDSIRVEPIRLEDAYGGQRVTLQAGLGAARLRVQVDVGIGDIVTPAPTWLEYPSLLGMPSPRLRAYSREAVVAEKLHAMIVLGSKNSRMKDYFDLYILAREGTQDAELLGTAIAATFRRRETEIPKTLPIGMSDEFARDTVKQTQWRAFLGKNRLDAPALEEVVMTIRDFVTEALRLARQKGGKT